MNRRVVPSHIVDVIERVFGDTDSRRRILELDAWVRANLKLVFRLSEELPTELLPDDFVTFQQCLLMIHTALEDEASRDFDSAHSYSPIRLLKLPGGDEFPIDALHRLLSSCPDEVPAPTASDLQFISDTYFRNLLRTDLSMVNRALSNGEWKAATVLAGSVVEALLLGVIRERPQAELDAAVTTLASQGKFKKPRESDPIGQSWSLVHYIEVAYYFDIIGKTAYEQSSLGRDFRNLIHPAKEQRGEGKCNRATALSAVAAIEHVVNDLTERHNKATH